MQSAGNECHWVTIGRFWFSDWIKSDASFLSQSCSEDNAKPTTLLTLKWKVKLVLLFKWMPEEFSFHVPVVLTLVGGGVTVNDKE